MLEIYCHKITSYIISIHAIFMFPLLGKLQEMFVDRPNMFSHLIEEQEKKWMNPRISEYSEPNFSTKKNTRRCVHVPVSVWEQWRIREKQLRRFSLCGIQQHLATI